MCEKLAIAFLIFLTQCGSWAAPPHSLRSSALPTIQVQARQFLLRSSFWLNLDSFLCEEALAAGQRTKRFSSIRRTPFKSLTAMDKRAWADALDYYQRNVIMHDREEHSREPSDQELGK